MMETRKCPYCHEKADVQETKNAGEFKFLPHRRWKAHSEDDSEERVHLRNIVDVVCEGSGKIIKQSKA